MKAIQTITKHYNGYHLIKTRTWVTEEGEVHVFKTWLTSKKTSYTIGSKFGMFLNKTHMPFLYDNFIDVIECFNQAHIQEVIVKEKITKTNKIRKQVK